MKHQVYLHVDTSIVLAGFQTKIFDRLPSQKAQREQALTKILQISPVLY